MTVSCVTRAGVSSDCFGVDIYRSHANRGPWVGCVFLARFNDAGAEWRGSEVAKVPQFPLLGGTGAPAACKNNARGYTCT